MDINFVAVASLDLSSAFDVVNINLLLTHLVAIRGLPKDIIKLLGEWLTSWVTVEVEGSCSELFDVVLGTIQGSVPVP